MNKSETLKAFSDAFAKFQGEVKNPPKSANNPFFKSKYTTLDVLIDTAKPILQKNGLSYFQSCSGDGASIMVTTLLMHSSGEWVESDPLTLKADKPTAQGAGSAITYARRYALAAALGLASDEDDDGNAATGNKKVSFDPPEQPEKTDSPKCSKEQVKELFLEANNKKSKTPGFDFVKTLESMLSEGRITTKYPYADQAQKIINWTIEDYKTIKTELELPF